MPWRVRFEKRAQKDLERLPPKDQERIARFVRDRIVNRADPREIGEALYISDRTVARHLTNIFTKIDVSSRIQAARYAIDHGLIARR